MKKENWIKQNADFRLFMSSKCPFVIFLSLIAAKQKTYLYRLEMALLGYHLHNEPDLFFFVVKTLSKIGETKLSFDMFSICPECFFSINDAFVIFGEREKGREVW